MALRSHQVDLKTGFNQAQEKSKRISERLQSDFRLVDQATVEYRHKEGIQIVPWTVNEVSDMDRMMMFDLDGIITDYPDRAIRIFRTRYAR